MGHLSTDRDYFNMMDDDASHRASFNVESLGSSTGQTAFNQYTGYEGEAEGVDSEEMFYVGTDFLPAEFRQLSVEVAEDIISYICRRNEAIPARCKTSTIMRSLVDDALLNRLEFMRDLVLRLGIDRYEQLDVLDNLVTQMFDDQIVTWGRIVTLHAFCAYLARYFYERNLSDCCVAIADSLSNIVINRLGLWIVANGGWAAFDAQFPALCFFDSSFLWKIIGLVGLLFGGVFAFYTSLQMLNPVT